MSFATEITGRICALLNSLEALSGVTTVKEFTAQSKSEPLAAPVIGVGLSEIEILEGAPGTVRCGATVKLTVYLPHRFQADRCIDIFGEAADALMTMPGVSAIRCGEITHDRTSGALVLKAEVSLSGMLFTPEPSGGERITQFRIKGDSTNVSIS